MVNKTLSVTNKKESDFDSIDKSKLYYSVYTINEKVWIYADLSTIVDGCLVFYDIDGEETVLIASFSPDYWKYCYEADSETGESISNQIPFWKRHERSPAQSPKDYKSTNAVTIHPRRQPV